VSLGHALNPGSQILPSLDLFRPTITPVRRYADNAKNADNADNAKRRTPVRRSVFRVPASEF
jgi:hypothetical protein